MEKNNINEAELENVRVLVEKCREEAKKRLIGQDYLIDGILTAFVAGGHVILEGVPGLAKTLAVKTFAEISGLDFKRIQFTPDLLPADVSGTLIYEQAKGSFSVRKGPVFTNVVLADEINRAPAKVQSAMLEAMEEKQVTIGEETYRLPEPFFVLATQNPIEQEGTYNLPEAELDRFLLKLNINYPSAEEELQIVKTQGAASKVPVNQILSAKDLLLGTKDSSPRIRFTISSSVYPFPKLLNRIGRTLPSSKIANCFSLRMKNPSLSMSVLQNAHAHGGKGQIFTVPGKENLAVGNLPILTG